MRFSDLKLLMIAFFLAMTISASAEVKVFKDFTLIDGTGAPAKPHQAMIVTDGRISWVGPEAQVKIPNSAQVIDFTGKYVLPGLIDGHVHLGIVENQVQDAKFYTEANIEEQLKTYAAYGVTAVAVYGTDKDLIYGMRNRQRTGRPREARIFTAGQGIVFKGGTGHSRHHNSGCHRAGGRKQVDADAANGADFIKLWMDDEHGMIPVKMPYSMSAAVIAEAHKHHLKAVAHVYILPTPRNC